MSFAYLSFLFLSFLPLFLILFASCNWWGRLDRVENRQESIQRHSLLDSGGRRLDQTSFALEWMVADQRVLIYPTGPFSFHIDSGYLGEADVLMIENRRAGGSMEESVIQAENVSVMRLDSTIATVDTSSTIHQERESKSAWKLPWWVWVILLVGVGVVMGNYTRHYAKRLL